MRISRTALHAGIAVVALGGATTAGCGGGEPKEERSTPPAGKATTLQLDSPGGAIRYDKKRLTAPAGRVTIEFTNDSDEAHNVIVIPGDKLDYERRAVLATSTVTRLTRETRTKATATLRPGAYTYYCSIQNHGAAGMVGKLLVR